MEFEINHIAYGSTEEYTQMAEYCTANNLWIDEIEPDEDGRRRFQLQNLPQQILSPEEIQERLTSIIQYKLDSFARTRNYDSIISCCSYFNSKDEKFSKEAEQCIDLRDATWRKAYEILDDVKSGKRNIPTEEELLEELGLNNLKWFDEVEE